MHKIIMLSGGSESTALLFRELKEMGNNSLTVHHVSLVNAEERHEAEAYAVRNIVTIARGYGDFIFTKSRFDYQDTLKNGYCGIDIHTIAFLSGHIAKQISVAFATNDVEVLFGASKEEEDPQGFLESIRYKMMIEAFNTHFIEEINHGIEPPRIYFPYIFESIHDQFKFIPEEVKQYIMSCRYPVKIDHKFIRCGNCYTCKKIQKEGLLDALKKR